MLQTMTEAVQCSVGKQSACSDINCCNLRRECLYHRNGYEPQDLLRQLEEEKNKIFQSRQKANTQYNVIPPIKQIVCTSTGEGERNFIRTLGEYNKNYLHLTVRSYKVLIAAKNSAPLWLSFSHEFLTQMNYPVRNYKFIGILLEYIEGHP